MSRQALDLKRSAQIVWRHKALVGAAALLGLLGAVLFTALYPPAYTSTALVAFPPSVEHFHPGRGRDQHPGPVARAAQRAPGTSWTRCTAASMPSKRPLG